MSSDGAQTLTHALVAEPYSSNQVHKGALHAVFHSENRVQRAVAVCPNSTPHSDVTRRPQDACARLLKDNYVHGQWSGRIEHRAGALRKSTSGTFDRISRGDEVEGHKHVDCNLGGPPGSMLQLTCPGRAHALPLHRHD